MLKYDQLFVEFKKTDNDRKYSNNLSLNRLNIEVKKIHQFSSETLFQPAPKLPVTPPNITKHNTKSASLSTYSTVQMNVYKCNYASHTL